MRMRSFISMLVIVMCAFGVAQKAPDRGPSTLEERQRFLNFAHKVEAAPLDESLRPEREWATLWLIQVPDIHVNLCTAPLGDFMKKKYKYSPEIVGQLMYSSAAFVIEHPEQADEKIAQYLAGVEGVLKAYTAILAAKPDAHSKPLDDLLQKQTQDQLADTVRDYAMKGCSK
jgi:hypothetical protein